MKKLFDEIPRLEGDRIILRKIDDRDAAALEELTGNPLVYRYLPTFLFEKQYDDAHEMIDRLYHSCYAGKESLILGICLKDGDRLCGLAEFYGYRAALRKTCVGYRLMERFWGRGIATEALALMVDYLFGQTDILLITASTMVDNHASERVLEKSGFAKSALRVPEDWGFDRLTLADKWFRQRRIDDILSAAGLIPKVWQG